MFGMAYRVSRVVLYTMTVPRVHARVCVHIEKVTDSSFYSRLSLAKRGARYHMRNPKLMESPFARAHAVSSV